MFHLALESIAKTGSLAIFSDGEVLWHRAIGDSGRTAAEFAVVLDQALRWLESQQQQLSFVSVAAGPGSFTGLRVGITTCKTLAYALKIPVMPVGTMIAIACNAAIASEHEPASDSPGNAWQATHRFQVGVNAYRGQVFRATFTGAELQRPEIKGRSATICSRSEWDALVNQAVADQETVCADAAILPKGDLPPGVSEIPKLLAIGVGVIAFRKLSSQSAAADHPSLGLQVAQENELLIDPMKLTADYIKRSAAEEKADSR